MRTSLFAFVAVVLASPLYAQSRSRNSPPPNINCEQMAAQSRGTISVEACSQMMSVQQAFAAALSDPNASRPGDDKMTCDQIVAEFKQQQITPPDTAKVAEAQSASDDLKKTIAQEQKEGAAMVLKESAEESVLSRLSPTNATNAAAAKRIEAEHKAANERMAKEQAPKAERMINAFGNLTADMGKQLSANPRLARLYQLANQKRCDMQGK